MNTTRRSFLRRAALAATGGILAACRRRQPLAPPVAGRRPSDPAGPLPAPTPLPLPGRYSEAPMLAERVARGELPPLEDRLPAVPFVCAAGDGATGRYGGALRRAWLLPPESLPFYPEMTSGVMGDLKGLVEPGMTCYLADLTLAPNLCASWEVNEDATRYVWHLRPGLKWSDGAPVTAEDLRFYYAHHAKAVSRPHPTLPPAEDALPEAEIAVHDDLTAEVRFSAPQPHHAHLSTRFSWLVPAHYLRQYHADYEDRAVLDARARAEGGADRDWALHYYLRSSWRFHTEIPALNAWLLQSAAREASDDGSAAAGSPPADMWARYIHQGGFLLERNPYFFQVDAEGRQLPYLDHIDTRILPDRDAFRMWLANGEAEYQSLGLTHDDISWLTDLQGAGGPRLVLAPSSRHATLQLNLSTADEALRALFGERAVHRALMLAIDREAINTLAYGGTWRARQFSPPEASPQYDAALAQAHIAYDPEEANRLLDEAGYAARDGEGYRRHPGGARVRIEIVGGAGEESASGQAAAAAADYLRAVGIDAAYRQITSEEYWRLHLAHNTLEAAWIEIDAPLLPLVHPTAFLGRGLSEAGHLPWAGLYAHHGLVAEGDPGAEPPPEGHFLWRLWQAGERLRTARSAAEQEAAWEEVVAIWREEIPLIGVLGQAPQPVLVARGLRGFTDGLPYDEWTGGLHLQRPQQLSWEHPDEHAWVP